MAQSGAGAWGAGSRLHPCRVRPPAACAPQQLRLIRAARSSGAAASTHLRLRWEAARGPRSQIGRQAVTGLTARGRCTLRRGGGKSGAVDGRVQHVWRSSRPASERRSSWAGERHGVWPTAASPEHQEFVDIDETHPRVAVPRRLQAPASGAPRRKHASGRTRAAAAARAPPCRHAPRSCNPARTPQHAGCPSSSSRPTHWS